MQSSIAPAFAALMLLAAPSGVRAEEAKAEKPLTKNQQKFDADQDGRLNDEEKAAARLAAREKAKQTRQENLAKYDADHDGKLDEAERAQKKAGQQAEREAQKAAKEAAAR